MKRHTLRPTVAILAALVAGLPCQAGAEAAPRKSLIGVNTARLSPEGPAAPTIDAMKTAGGFGSVPDPADRKAPLDAEGWPTGDFSVLVIDKVAGTAGTYKLSCQGRATVTAHPWSGRPATGAVRVRNLQFADGLTTADVEYRGGASNLLALKFTRTDGGVRDLQLLRPGYASDQPVFTDVYLKSKAPFGAVRLMDWTRTNSTTVVSWADRCKPADPQWSDAKKGGPWEPWFDWAKANGKDLWLCVPHAADDDYVAQLAKLCKERIGEAPVNLYLEDSNEYWNRQFPQHRWIEERAKALGLTGPRYHARRTIEIGQAFRAEFGAADPRVRPVLTGQLANPRATEDALEWAAEQYGDPKAALYAVASAPYYGDGYGAAKDLDATAEQLGDHLLLAVRVRWDLSNKTTQSVKHFHATAARYGVKSLAYECGPDLGHPPGRIPAEAMKRWEAARAAAQRLPQAGQSVAAFYDWWFEMGGAEAFHFNDFSRFSRSGMFGLTDRPDELAVPKFEGAAAAAAKYEQAGASIPPPLLPPVDPPSPQTQPGAPWRVEVLHRLDTLQQHIDALRAEVAAAEADRPD